MRHLFALSLATLAVFALLDPLVLAAPPARPTEVNFPGKDGVTLNGFLYLPSGSGPFPAVVALHGCSGLTDTSGQPSERHADWGTRLAAAGFVVLFPDSYGSRGLGPQCKVSDRDISPAKERPEDAKAALRYLVGRDDVRPEAVSLMGWSNGGSTTLYSVEPRRAPKQGEADFAKAIAFYPGCRDPLKSGKWTSRIPLLILIGEADDWTPAAPCHDLVDQAQAAGEQVSIIAYPGAYHDFDHPNLPVHIVEGLAFTATGSGQAHTGTDAKARSDAIARVPDFLAH